MKKLLTIVIVLIVLMGFMFVAGYQIALRATLVTVVIRNNASFTIGAARVEHEQGAAFVANVKRNRTAKIRFYSRDVNTCKLSVTFDNNRTIYSGERHVRPGYNLEESVTDSVITTLHK